MTFNPIQTESVKVTRAAGVDARRFVTPGGTYPAQGGFVAGVARTSGDQDEMVAVDVQGRIEVEASAALAVGALVQATADGRAEAHAGANYAAGRVWTASAAAGDIIEILRGV